VRAFLDLVLAAAAAGIFLTRVVLRSLFARKQEGPPKLMVVDAAYPLAQLRERRAEHTILSRDLQGFFTHVWSVHPIAGADRGGLVPMIGDLEITELSPLHTVIEAHEGRTLKLECFPRLNFVMSQGQLLVFLSRLVRRHGINVIRAGDPYYLGLFAWVLSRTARIPLVIRVNGNYDAIYKATGRPAYPRLFKKREREKPVERFVFSRAGLVAGANQNNLDYALANGARRDRATLFRYGVLIDPVHFRDPASRAGLPELEKRQWLTYVGRLEPVKHVEDLILVLARVRETHPEVGLVLVGEGSMHRQLIDLARAAGQSDALLLVGDKPQHWIASALTASAVILSPMTGRALVEAGLGGTPIVAYDVEWHSELITHEESGLLVPYRDTEAMAAAAIRLLDDAALSKDLARTCRKRTAEIMDPQRLLDHEAQAYRRLLTGS
jgi:glycosyltransferase involved in cell wall biosynthesis